MNKLSKEELLQLFEIINEAMLLDNKWYKVLRNTGLEDESSVYSYYGILNTTYKHYTGMSESNYYSLFSSPGDSKEKKKTHPVAWYRHNDKKNGSIPGPIDPVKEEACTGFIPDCINDVILNERYEPKVKLKLLDRFFKDLKKLDGKRK